MDRRNLKLLNTMIITTLLIQGFLLLRYMKIFIITNLSIENNCTYKHNQIFIFHF